jgi:hypothetical protein
MQFDGRKKRNVLVRIRGSVRSIPPAVIITVVLLCWGGGCVVWGVVSGVVEEHYYFTSARVAETQSRGDQIVGALKAYNAKNGRYPSSLDELVPAFIAEIPTPICGEPVWHYDYPGGNPTLFAGVGKGCYPRTYWLDSRWCIDD